MFNKENHKGVGCMDNPLLMGENTRESVLPGYPKTPNVFFLPKIFSTMVLCLVVAFCFNWHLGAG